MDDTDIALLVSPTLTSVNLGSARRAAAAAHSCSNGSPLPSCQPGA